MAKTIGILTGGGDVPGLNPCIKAVVYRAIDEGYQVLGIRRGWGGLLHFNPDEPGGFSTHFLPLDKQTVRTIDRTGGTILHTSRTNPSRVKLEDEPEFLRDPKHPKAEEADPRPRDFTPHVLKNLESLGIEILIPIGGDDTLSYGERLHREGVEVIAIPKTMDNDVFGTDYCIGFSTARHSQRPVHPSASNQQRLPRTHRGSRAVRTQQRRDQLDQLLPRRCRSRVDLRGGVRP